MDKQHILREIKRIATENGVPPGKRAFESETGIKESDWYPHFWLRWSEALTEAGYAGNLFVSKIPDDTLIEKYIALLRELRKIPIQGEMLRKRQSDESFPSEKAFRRFGGQRKLLDAVIAYCTEIPG